MSGFISWIRNLDMRKVAAVFSILTLIEMSIVSGDIPLSGAVPTAWLPGIVAWCKILIYVNNAIILGHMGTAAQWPKAAQPGGFNAKAAVALLAMAGVLALVYPHPVYALVRHRHVASVPVPASDPRLPANATLDSGTTPPAATVKQNILATAPADIAYAIQLATQANTPQSNVRKMCYVAIQALIPTTPTGTLPPGPDVVTHIEQGAELLDGLQPNSPVFVNCAGAAALAGQNVLTFVNAVVTGIAGIAVVAPKIPIP